MAAPTMGETAVRIAAYEEQLRALDEGAIYDLRAELDPDGRDAGYFSDNADAYAAWCEDVEGGVCFADQLVYAIERRGGVPLDPGEAR